MNEVPADPSPDEDGDDGWSVDSPKTMAKSLNLSPATLGRMRQEPDCGGLPYVKLSANRIGYLRRDWRAFLAARRVGSSPADKQA